MYSSTGYYRFKLRTILILGLVFTCFSFQAKSPLVTWKTLEAIGFKEKYVPDAGGYLLFPDFPEPVRKLNNTLVRIWGYAVPMDKTGATLALSANPYAACFFCGKAGPASVMTIRLKKPGTAFRIDDFVQFEGVLRLNSTDHNEFYYVLEAASLMGQRR